MPHLLICRSVHTLQHLGITHILCLCPSDLEDANVGDFPDLFTYKHLGVLLLLNLLSLVFV
jgi:atypical dual specificity phosphatase